ncbi:lasso peptide biosynthesis B2 protein [Kitasatospora sp. NPDC056651]|uniref:lasso peptide biosynthesis B2 protein n=1 Tax=Kitasatospora sp. NPDC056651 TaxID=3345892 RepID=UPI003687B51A
MGRISQRRRCFVRCRVGCRACRGGPWTAEFHARAWPPASARRRPWWTGSGPTWCGSPATWTACSPGAPSTAPRPVRSRRSASPPPPAPLSGAGPPQCPAWPPPCCSCGCFRSGTLSPSRAAARLPGRPARVADTESVLAGVRAAGTWRPGRVACLEESLAVHLGSALTGRPVRWVLGVRFAPRGAHAWVVADGHVIGQEEADRVWPYLAVLTTG